AGTKLCPPARNRASSPCSALLSSASSIDCAAMYRNGAGFMASARILAPELRRDLVHEQPQAPGRVLVRHRSQPKHHDDAANAERFELAEGLGYGRGRAADERMLRLDAGRRAATLFVADPHALLRIDPVAQRRAVLGHLFERRDGDPLGLGIGL